MRRISLTGWSLPGTLRTPAWVGVALLALWIGWMLPALGSLRPEPASVQVPDSTAILARLQQRDLLAADPGPVLIRLASPCGCEETPVESTPASLPGRVVDLRALPADPALPFTLIVVDGDGALRYAGPETVSTGCGSGRAVAVPVRSLIQTETTPIIVPHRCSCRGLTA